MASRSNRQRSWSGRGAERRMARRAEHVRRKRQVQAGIGGALALVLIVLGTTWLLGGFDSKPAQETELASLHLDAEGVTAANRRHRRPVTPPTTGEPRTGVHVRSTIQTDQGDIEAVIDLSGRRARRRASKYLGTAGLLRRHHLPPPRHHAQDPDTVATASGNGTGSPDVPVPGRGQADRARSAPPRRRRRGASPSPDASAGRRATTPRARSSCNTWTRTRTAASSPSCTATAPTSPPAYTLVGTVTRAWRSSRRSRPRAPWTPTTRPPRSASRQGPEDRQAARTGRALDRPDRRRRAESTPAADAPSAERVIAADRGRHIPTGTPTPTRGRDREFGTGQRQRAAARARLEREMAARREAARRKRLLQARIGAGVAGAVVLGAVVWIIVAASGGDEPAPPPTGGRPVRLPRGLPDAPTRPAARSPLPSGVKDVGKPPAEPPSSGFQVITFEHEPGHGQGRDGPVQDPVHREQHRLPGQQGLLRQHARATGW